ncbi:DDE-type integrase/transposase/recombinase [Azospirillum sp. A39]
MPAPAPAGEAKRPARPLSKADRDRLDVRLAVVDAFRAYERAGGQPRYKALPKFAGFWCAGEIDVPFWVRAALPSVSASSVERWVKAVEAGQAESLAGNYGNRKGSGALDRAAEDVLGYLIATVAERPEMPMHEVRRLLVHRFGEAVALLGGGTAPLPTTRHLQRLVQDWQDKNRQLSLRLANPDDWKSRSRVAIGSRSEGIERPNQLWEVDASPSDVLCSDGRRTVYVVVDVFTRRMMVLVTSTPRSSAVLLLIRMAILAWGVPEAIKTDNGSDFTSRETRRAFALLGPRHPVCEPYSPEEKPHVERAIGTLQHGLMPLLPGYTGHNVAARQAIRGREAFETRLGAREAEIFAVRLTGAELQQLIDVWVETRYHQAPHAGLGDRTPEEVAELHAGQEWRVADERQLDLLLMPAADAGGLRTVGKKGIQVENAHFWANELIPYVGTGNAFEVRLDPRDMGRIYVYRPEPFEFIAIAVNPERAGLSRAAMAAEAKALQDRWLAEARAQMRTAKKKFRPHEIADTLFGRAAPVQALPRAALPPPEPSAGLVAAARAAAAATPALPAPRTSEQRARTEDIARRIAAPATAVEKPEDRWWRRAQDIETRIAAGEAVEDTELDWLEQARQAAWYQARRRDAERKAAFVRPAS